MEPKIFKISKSFLAEREKIFVLIQIFIPFFVLGLVFVNHDYQKFGFWGIIIFMTFIIAFMEIILLLASDKMLNRINSNVIMVNNLGLEHKIGNFSENIAFKDISKVLLQRNDSDNVTGIIIHTSSETLHIAGYKGMNDLWESIEPHVTDELITNQDRAIIDPKTVTICTLLLTAALFLGFQKFKFGFLKQVDYLFLLAAGSFGLIYRPITRRLGIRFKKMETVLGTILVISGMILFLYKLVL